MHLILSQWEPLTCKQFTSSQSSSVLLNGQDQKGVTEGEMVGWHHQLKVHEFEQTQGDGEGGGSLLCCSPWGHRVGDN